MPGPSGLADWPRPFVFRATHLDDQTFAAGQQFYFDLNLFDITSTTLAYFILTFAQLASDGLGTGRRKVELASVNRLNQLGEPAAPLYENGSIKTQPAQTPLTLDLTPPLDRVSSLSLGFVTPTELKSGQQLASRPDFAIVVARARDRISTLRELYGPGPLSIDFRQFGERAALIKMTRYDLKSVEIQRRSTRTGQTHSLGGFTGEADYEGDLTEFMPYLNAAQWTGIGRQTVWGKGQIKISRFS